MGKNLAKCLISFENYLIEKKFQDASLCHPLGALKRFKNKSLFWSTVHRKPINQANIAVVDYYCSVIVSNIWLLVVHPTRLGHFYDLPSTWLY